MNKLYGNTTFTWDEIVAVLNDHIDFLRGPNRPDDKAECLARRLELKAFEKDLMFRFATGTQVAA